MNSTQRNEYYYPLRLVFTNVFKIVIIYIFRTCHDLIDVISYVDDWQAVVWSFIILNPRWSNHTMAYTLLQEQVSTQAPKRCFRTQCMMLMNIPKTSVNIICFSKFIHKCGTSLLCPCGVWHGLAFSKLTLTINILSATVQALLALDIEPGNHWAIPKSEQRKG